MASIASGMRSRWADERERSDQHESGVLEHPEVDCVERGEGCREANRRCRDHAIGERAAPPTRFVEEPAREARVLLGKRDALGHQPCREVDLPGIDGAAKEFGPRDRARRDGSVGLLPLPEPLVLVCSADQRANEEVGIEVDQSTEPIFAGSCRSVTLGSISFHPARGRILVESEGAL